ncbi:hypothetical protein ABFS82_06G064400 [Erythranthe guttata]|nr:PREDICTED: probable inactive serine/threonine-protein kinase bub1 [Erythranthe guttata]|eukprot:XP_012858497.1 PREDICTED: probable inactive serine/threonine-protein kinase bub1 [Erythranthe guttata]
MSNNGNTLYNNLFSTLISDIKSYSGTDPLLPWLRGIRKMKETLPPQLLKEKLPRFLQKCSETFLTDRRYCNDLRYLRVWLQLMDFVDDPKEVLRTMEMNKIGMKKSLFYQAYALYYEKTKKFDAAEKIYHLGVQNLAEPADELQKSYEQFLHRIKRHKIKRVQVGETNRGSLNHDNRMAANSSNIGLLNDQLLRKAVVTDSNGVDVKVEKEKNGKSCSDDTVVVKFVDTAIVGKSKTEDARHHGLVEPTINTKEAMNAINSMFQQPLEPSIARRTSKNQSKTGKLKNECKIFMDETTETSSKDLPIAGDNPPSDEAFEIYVDGEETNGASVFARPNDQECLKDSNPRKTNQGGFRDDTVVYRFVGSTISDEPEVENVWHHGLVDPTVNLKEAMKDINSMFGKPIEFTRKSRAKKSEKAPVSNNFGDFLILPDDEPNNEKAEDENPIEFAKKCSPKKRDQGPNVKKNNHAEFLIFPDDELENQQDSSLPSSSTGKGSDLFEQTICTKEAMNEINKLFAMPMDF